ncbi:MAG: ATP-dependent DNA helicase [Candidatus Latescibacteria bacterium]|nr:ATP-dependent DNA helicase [Candidatus Latescibacterota bacterium]
MAFFGGSRPVDAIRIHQKIQKSRPKEYTSEVTVSHTVETDKYILEIGGRIDGIYIYQDRTIIDEIKTTSKDLDLLTENDNPFHWGQAQSYAYIYATEQGLDKIDVQLTYYNIDTKETSEIRRTFSFTELEFFFQSLVFKYLEWADLTAEWQCKRDESIKKLVFPYPVYRDGQRAMAVHVYRAIKNGTQLIVQAPSGIGKTMAVLFPSIKAIGEGLTRKLFYLTARTTGRTVAEKAITDLLNYGLKLKVLTLTAKDKICFNPGSACTGEECEYARGHYDRVNEAIRDAFEINMFNRNTIVDLAGKHHVCPFEFSLDLSLWVDCIICDYNYAFDPRVYLRRFFLETTEEYTFLVDESHNLVDRSREMFSAELYKTPFMDLRKALRHDLPGICNILGRINTRLGKERKVCEKKQNPRVEKGYPSDLYPLLRKFLTASERWLSKNIKTPYRDTWLDMYFAVNGFMRVAEQYNESYATIYEKFEKDLRIKLFCIDPSVQLKEALERCRSAVFFSATMTPADYFRNILGMENSAANLVLPSPYPKENLCVLINDTISTLYKNRRNSQCDVVSALHALITHNKGNYLIFFPSYEYMVSVYEAFNEHYPEIRTIIQSPGMTENERDGFLNMFSQDNSDTMAGFAVMGGIFGEGIDFVGDRLSGAVIVGVGLPGISPERELIRDYFNERNSSGFEYAYMYPGINKVFQAAGRVIRSENDRGVVLLIGERFSARRYTSLFPSEWNPVIVSNGDEIQHVLNVFRSQV